MAAAWAFDPALSRAAIERAIRHADRLSERDRRLVTAYQMYDQGRAAEAEPIYRSLVATYPDDIDAWYQLGEVLIHHNAFRGRSWHEAREAFGRAVALEPSHELSITHVLLLDFVDGRAAETGALLARLDPEGAFHAAYAPIVLLLGDPEERARGFAALRHAVDPIVQVVAWLSQIGQGSHAAAPEVARLLTEPSRPASSRAGGYLLLAQIEAGQGRQRAARASLRAAEALDPAAALEIRAWLGLPAFLPDAPAELQALRAELERRVARGSPGSAPVTAQDSVRPQLQLYVLGLLSARLGDDAAARRHAAELERMGGPPSSGTLIPDLALAVRAEAARARGDAAEALALLERARLELSYNAAIGSPFFFQDRERFLRAELLGQAGRHAEAIGWYTAVTETSVAYGAIAHRRLAEIHDRLGDRARAAEHFARFVAVWENCDPELRPLREGAERRLAALRGGGG